jgi:hypothetical protein
MKVYYTFLTVCSCALNSPLYIKAVRLKSVRHNHIYFYLNVTAFFCLQRQSSGHCYRTITTRLDTLQLYSWYGIHYVIK